MIRIRGSRFWNIIIFIINKQARYVREFLILQDIIAIIYKVFKIIAIKVGGNMVEKKIKFESIVSDGEEKLVTSFFSEGVLHFSDDKNITQIDFSEPTDDELTLETSLFFQDDSIKIQREGQISMIQEFILNEEVHGTYETEFGSLATMSFTKVLDVSADTISGEIYLEYDFYLNGEQVSTIQLAIEYE